MPIIKKVSMSGMHVAVPPTCRHSFIGVSSIRQVPIILWQRGLPYRMQTEHSNEPEIRIIRLGLTLIVLLARAVR